MTGKYGSASIWLFVDGYRLALMKATGVRVKVEAVTEQTTGIGDAWEEHTPTGVSKVELAQTGGFFDTATKSSHEAFKDDYTLSPQSTQRVACAGFAGNTAGVDFVGVQGVFSAVYEVLAVNAELTKANIEYVATGAAEWGKLVQIYEAQTGDWTSAWVDNAAATSAGGAGYLQVNANFGAFTGILQHSADAGVSDSPTTVCAFTAVTASPIAERKAITGTIKRYVRFVGTVWGDLSPSASTSPSTSVSPSASTSISPSSSRSSSMSGSASVSPSASVSSSVSASRSTSASISPSTSRSPSVSSSASVSPTTAAGSAGSVSLLCGLYRA